MIDQPLAELSSARDLMTTHALAEVRETVAREKCRHGKLGFDDMSNRPDPALCSENGEVLAVAIRTQFSMAMIDELQDTDPQQYRVFCRIWHHQSEATLLLISDPKQAMYAFQGADVFIHMKARSEIHAHYTLDTNWCSALGMVNSVNKLFSQTNDTLVFREILFIPVKSAGKNQALRFVFEGETQSAMKMQLMEDESCGVGDYQDTMAQVCTAQIRDWLQAGQRGEALLMNSDDARPVHASDTSILVRSCWETARIRDALTLPETPPVYLSDRDSVFETLEAQEMLRLLQATVTPEHENTLRNALTTSVMGLDTLDIETLNNDKYTWDAIVKESDGYRQIWCKRDVMPMPWALISVRNIAENLLATAGGE